MRRSGASCRVGRAGALLLFCAGACSSSGGTKPIVYTPVAATAVGSQYTLTLGDLKMVIDGAHGARVVEFSLRGQNVLVTSDENINFGSTWWPSPQASWCTAGGGCWPPPDAIDTGPYTGGANQAGDAVILVSGAQSIDSIPGSSIVVTKQFSPAPASGAVDITYTLTNTSATASVSLAPWQLARVEPGGLTFFGKGSGAVTYAANSASTFSVDEIGGDLWYLQATVSHDSKAFADSTGWLAQVTPNQLLYLIAFPDIQPADAAPGEAEIELYTNSSYVELEAQGAVATLAPEDTLTWTVRWKLRPLPAGTTVAAGNADLAAFATTTHGE